VRLDDDIRWLVALISDTGMRLSEAVGLRQQDLKLDHEVPYVALVPHATRRLKTDSSERLIPLVGAPLWAAQRINESANSEYCFPRYCSDSVCNSNSASAAINKWIKTIAGPAAVIHGLRHSFRDRLRAVEAPVDLIDQLGGWSLQSAGQGYGDGYPLELQLIWLGRVVVS
jgi:integrase